MPSKWHVAGNKTTNKLSRKPPSFKRGESVRGASHCFCFRPQARTFLYHHGCLDDLLDDLLLDDGEDGASSLERVRPTAQARSNAACVGGEHQGDFAHLWKRKEARMHGEQWPRNSARPGKQRGWTKTCFELEKDIVLRK